MNRKSTLLLFICFIIIIAGMVGVLRSVLSNHQPEKKEIYTADIEQPTILQDEPDTNAPKIPKTIKINETGSMNESADSYWWLNSGAYVYKRDSLLKTVEGDLPENDPRRIQYGRQNPGETDNGYHPQNIFRLVTRNKWQEFAQQVYFEIADYHESADSHRAASNGVLLFNRYLDGNNLYYAGVRVDGMAVIKKKINGTYYTMAIASVFPGVYDRAQSPNLLPMNRWIGIKSEVHTLNDGTVSIKLYVDKDNSGIWQLALQTIDDNKKFGGPSLLLPGYGGLRSDFMDVVFDKYSIKQD